MRASFLVASAAAAESRPAAPISGNSLAVFGSRPWRRFPVVFPVVFVVLPVLSVAVLLLVLWLLLEDVAFGLFAFALLLPCLAPVVLDELDDVELWLPDCALELALLSCANPGKHVMPSARQKLSPMYFNGFKVASYRW